MLKNEYPENGTKKVGLATIVATDDGATITISTTDWKQVGNVSNTGGALTWGELAENIPEPQLPTIADADITAENYGDYIDLGTHIFSEGTTIDSEESETILSDWRILYVEKENGEITKLYAILSGLLPVENESIQSILSNVNLSYGADSDDYDRYMHVWSNNSLKELFEGLGIIDDGDNYTMYYDENGTNLIRPYYNNNWEALLPTTLKTAYSNIKVYGTPTAKLIADSYGEKNNTTYDYDSLCTQGSFYNPEFLNDVTSISGYWLATPAYAHFYDDDEYEEEEIHYTDYSYNGAAYIQCTDGVSYSDYYNAIRPVVILPANVKIEQNDNGVWEVK